jgi:NAD(P)-dependent dehydrogenase (short-subunit alcohol dehydrogenase family)
MVQPGFAGRHAIVTGGSQGIGAAMAKRLQAAGARVTVWDLDGTPKVDVSDPASIEKALAATHRIDILVNNAGIAVHGPAEEIPDDLLRQQFETNFFGPLSLVKEVLPSMIDNATGRIVNVTSIGGVLSSGFLSTYCASKHALDAVSLGMDIELQPFGIRVVTVVPGGFNTSIAANRPTVERPDTRYPRAREAMAAHDERLAAQSDLTPVTDAIIAAAFDDQPKARYLVGGGTAQLLVPVVDEAERIHQHLRARET